MLAVAGEDQQEQTRELEGFSSEERSRNPHHHIDPGFINKRLAISTFGTGFANAFERWRKPGDDHWTVLQNNHRFVDLALRYCTAFQVKTLGEALLDPRVGEVFCSTETLEGTDQIYESERVRNRVLPAFEYDREVYLDFGIEHFVASTGKTEMGTRSVISMIGVIREVGEDEVKIAPIIMGGPTFDHPWNKDIGLDLMWEAYSWYETYAEDIDEFNRIKGLSNPTDDEWLPVMEQLSEADVKEKLAEVLEVKPASKDWGGETSDLAATVHLAGDPARASFLLKGPANFAPMTPAMLGKNADQIQRLATTPSQLLIVQHCHQIGDAVWDTLRAFAVAPHHPRRYCVIDGQETYKILSRRTESYSAVAGANARRYDRRSRNTVPVTAGVVRGNTSYVWPSSLTRPADDVRTVYLDLNHWISLAKASTNHPDGRRHQAAMERLRDAKASGRFVFPLSSTHYMEMAGISDPRQRADITRVMEELSGFATLVSRTVVIRLEVEAALDAMGYERAHQYECVPLVGRGVGPAFGLRGGLRVRSEDGTDVTDQARNDYPGGAEAFDAKLAEAERRLERAVLQGPADDEVPDLQAIGWDPTTARAFAERRASEERAQAARLDADPKWRSGRLRDVISARYLFIELNEILAEALAARSLEMDHVLRDAESARSFVDSMPSSDVCVSLLRAAHRNPQTRWTANDIFDIDALSIAVPYCDIVVTERHAHHVLRNDGAPGRTGTTVCSKLANLEAEIAA
jgi:hypothetical protein